MLRHVFQPCFDHLRLCSLGGSAALLCKLGLSFLCQAWCYTFTGCGGRFCTASCVHAGWLRRGFSCLGARAFSLLCLWTARGRGWSASASHEDVQVKVIR